MEIKIGDKYFFKLKDGSIITGTIVDKDNDLGFLMITVNDKYNNLVSFRADEITKMELFKEEKLLTKINKVNNES